MYRIGLANFKCLGSFEWPCRTEIGFHLLPWLRNKQSISIHHRVSQLTTVCRNCSATCCRETFSTSITFITSNASIISLTFIAAITFIASLEMLVHSLHPMYLKDATHRTTERVSACRPLAWLAGKRERAEVSGAAKAMKQIWMLQGCVRWSPRRPKRACGQTEELRWDASC